ncbi:SRPBCC domain-containing protein [Streptomyces sp. NPDC002577]
MEHEVFVPVAVEPLREVLGDPVRVARAVPGLQQDAGEPPVSGRLKVRIGGHTITYRGALRIGGQPDGSYAVEGEATEARGTGGVKIGLLIRLTPADGGTTFAFTATATADGRAAELKSESVESGVRRLLNRFAEGLAAGAGAEGPETAEDALAEAEPAEAPEPGASVFETEVPPSSLDPFAENEGAPGAERPAEAAHARRTMIGRSAEEVDHAPPRGRYAPVPEPESISTTATLRWVAPAAALVVASAIVVGRALRRRR